MYPKKIENSESGEQEDTHLKQAKYDNKSVQQFPEIPLNSRVYVQIKPKSNWDPKTPLNSRVHVQIKPKSNCIPRIVIKKLRDRVYRVELENGAKLYRNRRFIKTIKGCEVSKKEHYYPHLNPREKENVKYYKYLQNNRKSVNTGGNSGSNSQSIAKEDYIMKC